MSEKMKDTVHPTHQSLLPPEDNKFHVGNGSDGKHYWLTPPALLASLDALHGPFDFDPCPFPKPDDFDGLTCEWGSNNYVNPPFGSILHQGPDDKKPKKKGPTAWARKAIAEAQKGKKVTLVYPVDKWLLMLLEAGAKVSNLGDVRWIATEDGSAGKGTGRHIACFVLDGANEPPNLRLNAYGPRTKFVGAHPYAAMLAAERPQPQTPRENTIAAIAAMPGVTTGDLARQLGVSNSAMRHRLDRMAAKGLVRDEKRTVYRQGGSSPVSHWFLSSQPTFSHAHQTHL